GGEGGVATDVETLLPGLHDRSHDHVLDESRVEIVAFHEGREGNRGEIHRMDVLEGPVATSHGSADCIDDDCVAHGVAPGGTRRGKQTVRSVCSPSLPSHE